MFQNELLELLDTFSIKDRNDVFALPPGQKPYFLGRLYKAFQNGVDTSLKTLPELGGVKFHFQSTGNLQDNNPNLPTESFFKKTCFYANRTVVTFPFEEIKSKKLLRTLKEKPASQWPNARDKGNRSLYFGEIGAGTRTGYGGMLGIKGKVYRIDPAAFDDFLSVIFQLRPAIEAGISEVFPAFPDTNKKFHAKKLGLTSANFQLEELDTQFRENFSLDASFRTKNGLSNILLPHFDSVPLERLIEIRDKESDLYMHFQRRLEHLLQDASKLDSEQKILEMMREVDEGVRELHGKFKHIQKMYQRKNIHILLKFLAAGMLVLSPLDPAAKASIASILGGISAFDYLTSKEDEVNSMLELKSDRFYLPWLVFQAGQEKNA